MLNKEQIRQELRNNANAEVFRSEFYEAYNKHAQARNSN